jgi:hypothetical protein
MKRFTTLLGFLAIAGSVLAGVTSGHAADGDLININFIPVEYYDVGSDSYVTYTGSAFQGGLDGQFWNEFYTQRLRSDVSLTYAMGSGSAAIRYSFGAVTSTESESGFSNTAVSGLMGGYVASGTSGGTITLSGLDADATYKVYLYSQGWMNDPVMNGQLMTITVNGDQTINQTYLSNTSRSSFVNGQNVITAYVNTNTGGQLNMLFTPSPGSSVVVLNALQIEAVSINVEGGGDPVPEPGTMVLLSFGTLLVSRYVRIGST